jgi:hypothetical protein
MPRIHLGRSEKEFISLEARTYMLLFESNDGRLCELAKHGAAGAWTEPRRYVPTSVVQQA